MANGHGLVSVILHTVNALTWVIQVDPPLDPPSDNPFGDYSLLFGYRAYTSLSQRYASLELLYGFTRSVGRSLQTDVVVTAMLTQTRDLLRAEVAEITRRYPNLAGAAGSAPA